MKKPTASNPFANAPKTAPTNVKKSKSKNRTEIDIGPQLDQLAAFKVVEKLLENEAAVVNSQVKEHIIGLFAEQAAESGTKPSSFVGVGERASASCEIRKRGSNMPLSDEVVELLDANEIPYEKKVKVPARLVLNPDLDQESLQRLADLVAKDKELKGMIVVMQQDEEYTNVVSDGTIDALAAKKDEALCHEILSSIATFAIGKFQFDGASIDQDKGVTEDAKAIAIAMLQENGVLPQAEAIASKKRKA